MRILNELFGIDEQQKEYNHNSRADSSLEEI